MMQTEKRRGPAPASGALGPEAVAFMMDLGICPGSECPFPGGVCDTRCPVLRGWVGDDADG